MTQLKLSIELLLCFYMCIVYFILTFLNIFTLALITSEAKKKINLAALSVLIRIRTNGYDKIVIIVAPDLYKF